MRYLYAAIVALVLSGICYAAEWGKQGQNVISPTTLQSSITTLTTNSATKATFGGYTSRTNAALTVRLPTTTAIPFALMSSSLRTAGFTF